MEPQEDPAALAAVCPRCGAPAGSRQFCAGCGLNLRLQGELPTAEQYEASEREKRWISAQKDKQRAEQESRAAEAAEARRAAQRAETEAQAARGAQIAREENRRRARPAGGSALAVEPGRISESAGREASKRRPAMIKAAAAVLVIAAIAGVAVVQNSDSGDPPPSVSDSAASSTPTSTSTDNAATDRDTGYTCGGLQDPTPIDIEVIGAACSTGRDVAERAVAELQTRSAFDVVYAGRTYSCEPAEAKDAILLCFSEGPDGNISVYLRDSPAPPEDAGPSNVDEPGTDCGTYKSPRGVLALTKTTKRGDCETARAAFKAYFRSDERETTEPGYPVEVVPTPGQRPYECVEATTGMFAYFCGADEGAETYGANAP